MDRQRQKWVVRGHALTHSLESKAEPKPPAPTPTAPSSGEWEDMVTAANAVVEAVRRGGMRAEDEE